MDFQHNVAVANGYGGESAVVQVEQPLLEVRKFVSVHDRTAADLLRLVERSPAAHVQLCIMHYA